MHVMLATYNKNILIRALWSLPTFGGYSNTVNFGLLHKNNENEKNGHEMHTKMHSIHPRTHSYNKTT